ncbi:hypothetical protein [Rhizobium changzhiense]|uniref:hypothetical protein n=1 Tax=Rhizobium changzhiense TaxID=2692317 RepID=UPI001FEEB991|nr:hypothetical protein [Rhizobium changzhiense]
MPEQGNPEIARRRKVIGIWFWSLVLLSVTTWVLMSRFPTQGVCYFRDIWFLRALWHQNITVYEQLIKLGHSNSQQCVFFATRSMLSLYFATFACVAQIYSPWEERTASRAWLGMAFITVFLIGNQIFFDGFNDQSHGRYSAIAYRTYDSIHSLIWKSIIRMFLFYVFLTFWLLVALEWRRNRFRHGGSESQEAPLQQSDNATKLPFTHPLSSRPPTP